MTRPTDSPTAMFSGSMRAWRGKLPCPTMSYNQAFDYAIRDIEQNAENYLADFLAH